MVANDGAYHTRRHQQRRAYRVPHTQTTWELLEVWLTLDRSEFQDCPATEVAVKILQLPIVVSNTPLWG